MGGRIRRLTRPLVRAVPSIVRPIRQWWRTRTVGDKPSSPNRFPVFIGRGRPRASNRAAATMFAIEHGGLARVGEGWANLPMPSTCPRRILGSPERRQAWSRFGSRWTLPCPPSKSEPRPPTSLSGGPRSGRGSTPSASPSTPSATAPSRSPRAAASSGDLGSGAVRLVRPAPGGRLGAGLQRLPPRQPVGAAGPTDSRRRQPGRVGLAPPAQQPQRTPRGPGPEGRRPAASSWLSAQDPVQAGAPERVSEQNGSNDRRPRQVAMGMPSVMSEELDRLPGARTGPNGPGDDHWQLRPRRHGLGGPRGSPWSCARRPRLPG